MHTWWIVVYAAVALGILLAPAIMGDKDCAQDLGPVVGVAIFWPALLPLGLLVLTIAGICTGFDKGYNLLTNKMADFWREREIQKTLPKPEPKLEPEVVELPEPGYRDMNCQGCGRTIAGE